MTQKKIETVVTTSNSSKLTIAADRVTVKIGTDGLDRNFLEGLAERCKNVILPQTGRAKLSAKDLEWGSVPLYSGNSNGHRQVIGRLYFKEEPVRFELKVGNNE